MAQRGRHKKTSNLKSNTPTDRSYKNLLWGMATFLVFFTVVFFGLNLFKKTGVGTVGPDGITTSRENVSRTYTVSEGENLWTISEKIYNDGYQWKKLAAANNIVNPDVIEKGEKLILPSLEQTVPTNIPLTITPVPSLTSTVLGTQRLGGETYTVVSGDNLWGIAVRAYGDGFKWVEIAKANNLVNPDLIHPGNVFRIPR